MMNDKFKGCLLGTAIGDSLGAGGEGSIIIGLFILSIISGMLGLGVAFAATPFLELFLPDLVHQVQPLNLLLNGVTALLATIGFSRSGYVDWRRTITLAIITTLFAPVGAYLVQFVKQTYVWFIYFISVIYLL